MILHKHRCIFFHVPKTAGTALERMLLPGVRKPYEQNREIMFGFDNEIRIFLQHATCRATRKLLERHVYDEYFKFAVVRNPFARLVSVYYYRIRIHNKKFGNFRGFVRALPDLATDPHGLNGSHYIAQTNYTHIDDRQEVQFIGRCENLTEVIETLRSAMGSDSVSALPELSAQVRKDRLRRLREAYDPETLSIVRDVYSEDFETFGYCDQALPD